MKIISPIWYTIGYGTRKPYRPIRTRHLGAVFYKPECSDYIKDEPCKPELVKSSLALIDYYGFPTMDKVSEKDLGLYVRKYL
jgi:hypothetical protein